MSSSLPSEIPLLSLEGELLFPASTVKVSLVGYNAFAVLADSSRNNNYIGIVQTNPRNGFLYRCGTLGEIEIESLEKDSVDILIKGICRFEVVDFVHTKQGYYRAIVAYHKYKNGATGIINRKQILNILGHTTKVDTLLNCDDEAFIGYLMDLCPFSATERQCILEQYSPYEQYGVIKQLLQLETGYVTH